MGTTDSDTVQTPRLGKTGGVMQYGWALWARHVVWIQGIYYLLMGLWPVLNIGSFEEATGPKTETWLVKTVGLLLVAAGFALVLAAYRRRIRMEMAVLGIGIALALLLIEIIYVIGGTISPIYLFDALIQILLIAGWLSRVESYI